MLFTDDYMRLNADKHAESDDYGALGGAWAVLIKKLCDHLETKDVLDYGCGKATLQQYLPFPIQNYDPAIPKYSASPVPADVLVCTDVLEHIEPECIDDVIAHLKALCKKGFFFTVACRPSIKRLSDGGLTHRLIMEPSWWLEKLVPHFLILNYDLRLEDATMVVTGLPKDSEPKLMKAWTEAVDKQRGELETAEAAA